MSGKTLVIAAIIAVALHCSVAFVPAPAVDLLEIRENKTLEMSLVPAYKEASDVSEVEEREPVKERPTVVHRKTEPLNKRVEKTVTRKEADQTEEEQKHDLPREIIPAEPSQKATEETDPPQEIVSVEKPGEETKEPVPPREIVAATISEERPPLQTVPHEDGQSEQAVIVPAMPRYQCNPPPKYPAIARRRGYEGRVLLSAMISTDGTVVELTVKESSGHLILDRAAVKAVETWKFDPATRMGFPIPLSVDVPVRFVLNHP
ncbi:MAG TPA: energy transducer TonB [Syntrophales bacterium]|nr:energy transducer TonB [Syntrophales bacterium]HPQ44320.1 energy transducer TonB [Syntrophales bacterium]